tara:strand:+ start:13145 stop:14149 length:1005 start_codon:yes stop_codon:yes gene_type:complete
MDYKNKQDKYNKIMGRIGKNLKPIFDRMIEKQTEKIREKTPVDYTEVMPSCGITTRNIPLTEEQLEMGKNLVDTAITSIIDATEDYPDLINQIPQRVREMADKGEGGRDKHRVRLIPLEFPQWLKDLKSEVKGYFVKKKSRKGYDWEEMVKGRISKAKEKITKEYNALYVFIDTSGSMQWNTDDNGVPLLKLFSSYLPVIAEKYKGEVWQTTSARYGDPDPIKLRTKLSDFKYNSLLPPTEKQFDTIGGMGTNFWGVWQYFDKKVREAKEKHADAKVMMIFFSDMDENLKDHPELIHGKDVIFVTDEVPPATNDVMQYINGDNIKLIAVNKKKK